MRVRRCAAVVLLVVFAAACGSGSSSGSSTTTTRREPARDRDDAQRALVTAEDLPDGWLAGGGASAGPMAIVDTSNLDAIARCLHVAPSKITPPGAVTQTSPVFQGPDQSTTVQSRVSVLASQAQASGVLEAFGAKAFAGCVKQRVEESLGRPVEHPVLPPDIEVAAVSVVPLKWPKYGDGSRAIRQRTSLVGDQSGLDLYLQLVVIARGRSVATIAFTSRRDPFPLDLAENLSLVLSNRLP